MAFQPIVDVDTHTVFAYEALVRGPQGQSAFSVLSQLTDENRYAFDQNCRIAAITTAARLGLAKTGARLSINFMPGAVYSATACIKLTLDTARRCNFPSTTSYSSSPRLKKFATSPTSTASSTSTAGTVSKSPWTTSVPATPA